MVILGGLEIAAVGYLLNEFNKDKIEAREKRKQSQSHHRPDNERPYDDRPFSRPHSNSRPPPPAPYPPQGSSHNLLLPPQAPLRPSSAPPQDNRPEWQRQQQQPFPPQGPQMGQQYQPQQMQRPPNGLQQRPQGQSHEMPGNDYPFQTQLWHKQQGQQGPQPHPPQQQNQRPPPNQPPNQNPLWQPGPQPGPQGPGQFQNQSSPQQQYNNNGPPPPGPGHLQRPQTFQPGQQPPPQYQQGPSSGPPSQPHLPTSNTFPLQNQNTNQPPRPQTTSIFDPHAPTKPAPTGPLVYINTRTGKVSHNLYPSDHPMHRSLQNTQPPDATGDWVLARSGPGTNLDGVSHDDVVQHMPREFWGDEKYMRTMAGDIHTGLMWSERDEEDLAYGKDYGGEYERKKGGRRRAGSGWREGSYERVRVERRGEEWA